MKVLVFGNAYGNGGVQTSFRELVMFLRDEGHTVGSVAIAHGGDGVDRAEKISPRKYIRPWRFGLKGAVKKTLDVTSAVTAAHRFAPEVFVALGLSNDANLIARAVGRNCFKLSLDVIAGRPVNDPPLVAAARLFDAMALQSPSMVGMLTRQGFNNAPLSWLPCLSLPLIPHYERKPNTGHVRLAYFGRLAGNKGIDVFLEALSEFRAEEPFSFDLHGEGKKRDRLTALAVKLRGSVAIEFRGAYPAGEERARLMCGYDALVVPSQRNEGLPLVLLEAMGYGIPVLTTNIGAIPDCCDGNPDFLMVSPDRASLKGGIEMLMQGLRAGRFNTARLRQYYETHFSRTVMAQRWRRFLSDPKGFFE